MIFPKNPKYNDFLGHYTLLHGETDTKKTFYTAKFIKFLLEDRKIDPLNITILDFAPQLNTINNVKIGGKVTDYYKDSIICNNIIFEGDIIPPRLNASNKRELYENSCHNYKKTSKILEKYNENPTSVLIINDISIYLHLGSKNYIIETIKKSETFFGNSYYGSSIAQDFAKLFSLKERNNILYLIKNIEFSYLTKNEV
jgi:hypothetical protein